MRAKNELDDDDNDDDATRGSIYMFKTHAQ
jgi:hypothetical protein